MKTLTPLLTALLLANTNAVEIYFTSSIAGGHNTSTGSPLNGDTLVELGTFTAGFIPSAANKAEWQSHWHRASLALYDSQNGWYSGTYTLTANTAPFTTDQKGWIWVHNRAGEMTLYSRNTWTWPSASNAVATPVEWAVEEANTTIIGSTNTNGKELTTASAGANTPSPALTYASWAQLQFGPNGADKNADADADGASNFAEYAFGSRADQANNAPGNCQTTCTDNQGNKYLAVGIGKGWVTGITYTGKMSTDLINWSSDDIIVEQNDNQTYTARDNQALGQRQKCFLRLEASE